MSLDQILGIACIAVWTILPLLVTRAWVRNRNPHFRMIIYRYRIDEEYPLAVYVELPPLVCKMKGCPHEIIPHLPDPGSRLDDDIEVAGWEIQPL